MSSLQNFMCTQYSMMGEKNTTRCMGLLEVN